jgi:hypothetical protein
MSSCTLVEVDRRFRGKYLIIRALMIEAVRTSETSVYFHDTTRRSIQEGCHLHNRRREKLKNLKYFSVHIVRAFES